MKNFFTYKFFLIIFLFIILLICFGSIIQFHNKGGQQFKLLRQTSVIISEIPFRIFHIVKYKDIYFDKPKAKKKEFNKKDYSTTFSDINKNALLVLPIYVEDLHKSVIKIIDLSNSENIYTYDFDIKKINELSGLNFKNYRFLYYHPLLLDDGSIILKGNNTPIFKIDLCNNLEWVNYNEKTHHSTEIDDENNVWVPARFIYNLKKNNFFENDDKKMLDRVIDDAILKINLKGQVLFKKSVLEILLENNVIKSKYDYIKNATPIHLNDIEPALSDTQFWKKGDLFLSLRNPSSIIHYRPSNNKVINVISGWPINEQHDVDIISENEISIFNNKNFYIDSRNSEILIYNLETKKFKKLFDKELQKLNFKTRTQGLSHIFTDGSLLVEESVFGRIILLSNEGKKIIEYVNEDLKKNRGRITWSRVIEDKQFIEKFKTSINNSKCLN